MEWWRTRYLFSGWIFAGTVVLLTRTLPGLACLLEDKPESAVAIIGLSGPPLGYIVYTVFFLVYHLCGGTGLFVHHTLLVSEAKRLYREMLDRQARTPTLLGKAQRALQILEGSRKDDSNKRTAFTERAIYTVVWQSFAPEKLRNACHRRWESFHTSGGIVAGLAVAVGVSWGLSGWSGCQGFWCRNVAPLIAVGVVTLLLLANMCMVERQAANQENLWIELFLKELEDRPDLLFQVV